MTSDGIVKPCARELQRYRKLLGAENIALLCDIQTKHTFMLSSAISIEESALMATECGADALIITGAHTGSASPLETIRRVREVTKLPLIAGSGVNAQNAADQLSLVEAAIVGSGHEAARQGGGAHRRGSGSQAHAERQGLPLIPLRLYGQLRCSEAYPSIHHVRKEV